MKLYLDTGNVEDIKKAVATGVVDGVTTNPSLIAKEGRDFATVIKEIAAIFNEAGVQEFTVSAEVTALTADGMVREAEPLARLDPHVIVKVPLIPEGVKAISILSKKGIRTNATLCFSANQALLAAKAGATFVSPFIGRLDDVGEDGMALIESIRDVYDNYGFATEILAASIRSPLHVTQSAEAGADIATLPPKIFWQLFDHPLTAAGLEKFLTDWDSFKKGRDRPEEKETTKKERNGRGRP